MHFKWSARNPVCDDIRSMLIRDTLKTLRNSSDQPLGWYTQTVCNKLLRRSNKMQPTNSYHRMETSVSLKRPLTEDLQKFALLKWRVILFI